MDFSLGNMDAFFYDELGCNYVNHLGKVICLYEKLDKATEDYIKNNSKFISVNDNDSIQRFIRKYLNSLKIRKQIQSDLEQFANIDCFFMDGMIINFVTARGIMSLMTEDLINEYYFYLRKLIPSLNSDEEIQYFIESCKKRYGW